MKEAFLPTLEQMLVMFSFILAGYILNKKKVLTDGADAVMSKLENFLFVPALVLNTFMTKCTVTNLRSTWIYIIYSAVLLAAAILIAHFLCRLFSHNSYRRHIYEYALTFGNFAFMGNAVVLALLGEDMLFKYLIFTLPLNLAVYTWGTIILIPKDKAVKKFNPKAFCNPIIISLVLGMSLGLTGTAKYVPSPISSAVSLAGGCMGPVAMILTGFVIASYPLSSLLSKKRIYAATALRLIVIPAIFLVVLKLIGASEDVLTLTLFAYATPLGLNTVIFPSAYGGDTKTGARMASISHLLSIVTIPVMYLIFIR